ncbi:MAG TPA: hypothetical protein VFE84_04825, partial [Patescibacteria group bacterium]|nr:hypothetical protein [Patescibacteria group bacterium]
MKKLYMGMVVAALVSLAIPPAAPISAAEGDGGLKAQLDSLVGSERAFCKMAMGQGIRPAFLRYLSPQSVVFRPTAVDGRQWYGDHTDLQGILSWEPEFAEVSRAADLGYT